MKKISLKTVKKSLKRDEMRTISGGSGSGGSFYCRCLGYGASGWVRSCDACRNLCAIVGAGFICT